MEIMIGLATKIGYVCIVGATSMLANTLIAYHHHHSGAKKKPKVDNSRAENRPTNDKLKEIRKLHQAE